MDDRWLVTWHRRGFTTQEAIALRAALLALKRALRRGAHGPHKVDWLNRKRFAARKMRERRKSLLSLFPTRWDRKTVEQSQVSSSAILDGLHPDRSLEWQPIYERPFRTGAVDIPSFSFIDDPIAAVQKLKEIAVLEARVQDARINFSDNSCSDIGPYLVLQEMQRGMIPVFSGGTISRRIQLVVDHVGLRNALRMQFDGPEPSRDDPIWPLPFRRRQAQGDSSERLLRAQTSEQTAAEVMTELNGWLQTFADREFTRRGEGLVYGMTGEAMNNAERHSDPDSIDGSWSIAGYLVPDRRGDQETYRCHLALLSTGATISETMKTAGVKTRAKMREYVRRHRNLFERRFSEESLETVFALQDGVSRVETALESGRGGTGLLDIVQFFSALADNADPTQHAPGLAIVSGSTCIICRQPYIEGRRMRETSEDGLRAPRELWFNANNTPQEPPDTNFVISLPAKVSGTLITMAWTIDPTYLQSREND
jgi:hypothetical protein